MFFKKYFRTNSQKSDVLFQAITSKDIEQVRQALKTKETNPEAINDKDPSEKTPLMRAVESGIIGMVELLLQQKNIDLNTQDQDGNTALHQAYSAGHEEIKNRLLQAGAKMDIPNHQGHKPGDSETTSTKLPEVMAAVYMGPPQPPRSFDSINIENLFDTPTRPLPTVKPNESTPRADSPSNDAVYMGPDDGLFM